MDDKENVNPNMNKGAYSDDEMTNLVKYAVESGWYTCGDIRGNIDNIYNMMGRTRDKRSIRRKLRRYVNVHRIYNM